MNRDKELADLPYWLAVHQVLGINMTKYLHNLLQYYGSMQALWLARDQISSTTLPENLRQKILLARKTINPEQLWEDCQNRQVGIINCQNQAFSKELLQIPLYPCILYYYGNVKLLQEPAIAMVGSRQCSAYGVSQAKYLATALASQGITIVSGMAAGIDAAAHEGALAGSGGTIAVLGSGIDVPYPRENRALYRRLCQEALVISEFPLGAQPRKWQFPQRNRIISGLARLVLLIEAQARSGALITCDFALEQGKEVCALPGPVTNPGSIGPLRLIQQGAKLIITPQDIIAELKHTDLTDWSKPQKQIKFFDIDDDFEGPFVKPTLSKAEQQLISCLTYEPMHIDFLLDQAKLERGQVYLALSNLKHLKLIDELPGNYYLRI